MVLLKDHVTVILRPDIVHSNWADIEEFGAQIREELERRDSPICIVDLSPLTYMGSSIVALIVRLWKVIQFRGGKMVVVCSHPTVIDVIKLAGLDKIWTLAPDISTARKKLGVTLVTANETGVSTPGQARQTAGGPSDAGNSPSLRVLYYSIGAITVLAVVTFILVIVFRQ